MIAMPSGMNGVRYLAAGTGGARLLLGCDLVVAGGREALLTLAPGQGHAVVNAHEMMTGDFTRNADFSLPAEALKRAIVKVAGERATIVEGTRLATALLGDATLAPLAGPTVDVIAAAKTDLKAGQRLDGLGEYMTYGLAENADTVAREALLPIGLAEGCRLKRDISRDACIRRADVEIPEGRLIDRLRDEQDACFNLLPMEQRTA